MSEARLRSGGKSSTRKRVVKRVARKRVAKRVAKTVVRKRVAKKVVRKRTAKQTGGKRKLNPAMMKKYKPDAVLAAVVGSASRPRQKFMKDIWDYIKKHGLQGTVNKREIIAKKDAALRKWAGKDVITMFEVMKILNKHIEVSESK